MIVPSVRNEGLNPAREAAVTSVRIPSSLPTINGTARRCGTRIATAPISVAGSEDSAIMRLAVTVLRRQYSQEIDPAGLLDGPFTVLQLRRTYQAVKGTR